MACPDLGRRRAAFALQHACERALLAPPCRLLTHTACFSGSEHHSKAFPEQPVSTCFYQDYDSRMTEVHRRRKACQVEWVEVEVEAGKKPRPWSELKTILLDSLQVSLIP